MSHNIMRIAQIQTPQREVDRRGGPKILKEYYSISIDFQSLVVDGTYSVDASFVET